MKTLLPKNRLEAFSDGVLAIVITILVLELKVPELGANESLVMALGHDWRDFFGYLISFVMVGGSWVAHANATRMISKGDPVLFRITLVWLLFLSLIPFTTSLMSQFFETPEEKAAVVIYGLNLFLASGVLNLVISYSASQPKLSAQRGSGEEMRQTVKQRNYLLAFQAAAILCALFDPAIAVFFFFVITLLFVLGPLVSAGRHRRAARAK